MIKLKTILLSNTSKYIHISIWISLALFTRKQPFIIVVVFLYSLYLYKQSKQLLYITLLFSIIIGFRLWQMNQYEASDLPLLATIIAVEDDYLVVKDTEKMMVYYDETSRFKPGMIIFIDGTYYDLDDRHIENQFSYGTYLESINIQKLISADKIDVIEEKFHINIIPYTIQHLIEESFDPPVTDYLCLLILGDKDLIDESILQQSKAIGISHLFAISGMHLGIILIAVNAVLDKLYIQRKTHVLCLALILFLYNTITGFSISILRASILYILIFSSKRNKFPLSKLDYLSFIFVAFIIYHPYTIFYVGFQLSFLITAVIILSLKRGDKSPKLHQLYRLTGLAFLFGLPIVLSLNNHFGLMNVVYGPIFILFVSLILLPGAFFTFVLPFLRHIFLQSIHVFEFLISTAYHMNDYIYVSFSHGFFVLSYWFLLVFTFAYYRPKRLCKIMALWLVFFLFLFNFNHLDFRTKVIIFDVNQGDSIFIQSPQCKLLIDTGKGDDYDTLIHYFKSKNISALDGLVLTHQHADHIGEAYDLVQALSVGQIYTNRINNDIDSNTQIVVKQGDIIQCGQLAFSVLNANREDKNENNNSLVLHTIINDETWLFAADIEAVVETELIQRYHFQIDHLKVAHHGSNTSSTRAFIEHFNPKHIYVSVGKNDYGLPDQDVLKRFLQANRMVYSTQEFGTIEVVYMGSITYQSRYKNGQKDYHFFE